MFDQDYVNTVAGHKVSEDEAWEFIRGLEQFLSVSYDNVDNDGFLVGKKSKFNSIKAAKEFIRRLQSPTKPIIEE
jgi:hypothetical protein